MSNFTGSAYSPVRAVLGVNHDISEMTAEILDCGRSVSVGEQEWVSCAPYEFFACYEELVDRLTVSANLVRRIHENIQFN